MLARSFRRFFAGKKKPIVNTMKASKAPKARKRPHLSLELLEDRVTPTTFTPGNLVILQAGDGVTPYNAQAPLFLNEVNPTSGANVQQVAIPAVGGVGNANNQPITIDLSAAAGNGQLNRSYDGSSLTFDGVDSTVNNGGLTAPATPSGQDNRVIAVVTGDPTNPANINTTTYGPFYVGDDNRGSVAESPTGPIYTAGHPNQAGGAVSQGVHEFDTEGPSIGTQVSATTNVRGVTIGFDNRMYFTTASGQGGAAALNTAGIFTEAQALPTAANTPAVPASDIQVVPAIFGASKLGGVYLADVNGDGVIDNGDRLYFVDDGTVGGAGTGGLYVATWNDSITSNPWNTNAPGLGGNNAAAVAAGIINHWSAPVRLGDAPTQPGSNNVGQLRGLTGTVLSPTEVQLYTTAYDNAANDSSYVQGWDDTHSGVAIASASESGTTVTITTLTPNGFATGDVVEVDGVGANNGAGAITSGYNGAWSITVVDSTHFTYTDTNSGASNLATVSNQGAADATINATTVQTLAAGSETVGSKAVGEVGLRGVAFAPVAATSISLSQSPANPLSPGTAVTLTATLTNSQVTPTGQVAFIDQNTNTVLGFGTISTTGGVTTASLTLPTGVVGNHYVKAYFGGGGTLDLASANSNTIQVIEAGSTASSTGLNASLSAVAIGKQDVLTATVTDPSSVGTPTGTVSFYNGSIALANLLGTATLSGTTATLTTAFGTAGAQTILAVYNGDNTYASSEATQTVNVAANATATITTSANNVALNATPTYTATIVGNATLGTPAGTVTFTLVSATTNGSRAPLVSASSGPITLTAGAGNTATATWTSPALSAPGSYFVTMSYSAAGTTNPYSSFAVNTTSATNGVALIETVQKAFTPGDLVAVQRGDGTVNLGSSAYPVELVEYKQGGGAEVQAIVLPNTDSGSQHALFLSGQNGAEGLLNRSANGAVLTVAGYDLPAGHTFITSTFPFQFPRTVAEVGASGAVDTSTAISTTQVGLTALSESGTTVTATATSVAGLSVGQSVVITGVTPAGYDGQFTITGINAGANTFTYTAAAGLGAATVSSAFATTSSVPYNPLDVVSNNGQQFWLVSSLPVGDTTDNGIEYVAGVGATGATQIGAGNNAAAAVSISGGQLYITKGSGNIDAVGTGLPTTPGQPLTGLPNLANAYASFFPNAENPEQILLLNTNDGTTNSPNVAYIADQANGLLKFYLNSASISNLTESGTTVTVTTNNASSSAYQTGDTVQIAGASVAGYNGTFTITNTGLNTFTYTATASGLANATGGTASEWLYGSGGTGVFGQKLVSAGGATGLTGYVKNPGAGAQVQLFVTGVNVQQQNPNQIDSFLDTNAPGQGFPSGNFTNLGFVGGASSTGSPNGNENFAGLAFAPGAVTTTTVASSAPVTTYGNNVTFTATVTSPVDTPAGTVTFMDGSTVLGTSTLNGSGVATFTTTTPLSVAAHTITAVYNPGGASLANDDSSTGTVSQEIDYAHGDLIVSTVQTGAQVGGGIASITEGTVNGVANTVTVTTNSPHFLQSGQSVVIAGVTPAGYNNTINNTFSVTVTGANTFTLVNPVYSGLAAGSGGTVTLVYSGLAGATTLEDFTGSTHNTGNDVALPTAGSTAAITGFSYTTTAITAASESGTTVTITTSASNPFVTGQTVTVAGISPTGYDGTFAVTQVDATHYTYTAGSSGLAVGVLTGATANSTVTVTANNTFTAGQSVVIAGVVGSRSSAITAASESGTTVTITTSVPNLFGNGEAVTIAGITPSGYDGTFILSTVSGKANQYTYTAASGLGTATLSGATATATTEPLNGTFVIQSATPTQFTIAVAPLPGSYVSGGTATVATNALTENGLNPSSVEGLITDAADGHSANIAGYNQAVGGSTGSSENRVVGVLSADGAVNTGTQLASQVGAVRATVAPDGLGMYVASGAGIVYVPFDSTADVSNITGASWASGVATITAANNFQAGQNIAVFGVSPSGYNGTFTILSANATSFTYAVANPGATVNVLGALAQLLPVVVTQEGNNANNSGQVPKIVTIGAENPDSNTTIPGQLVGTAGNQFQNNGIPSVDGPFYVGSNLPESGGQSISILGSGTNQNWPTAQDSFGNFPTTNQIAISPDGNTIFVADNRTDSKGGILEYYQTLAGSWARVGTLQLDNFQISSASESGNVVTIVASTNFTVGQVVAVNGLSVGGYNTNSAVVTSVSGSSFTFTSAFSNLANATPGAFGAFANGLDGGFNSLTADFSGASPVLYGTTSGQSGNRLYQITGGTTDGSPASLSATLLATAPTGTAFRGVALAPTNPGATPSTTTLPAGPVSTNYQSGTTLTATVTTGATGWVSFRNQATGAEIGAAPIIGNTATLHTSGDLAPGTYNIVAVYTGDGTYAASTSAAEQVTVAQSSSTTNLSFSPTVAGTGQTVTLTARINASATGNVPTGTVTFTNVTSGNTVIGTAAVVQTVVNVNGTPTVEYIATLTTSFATKNTYSIQAAYSGDVNYTGSSDTESVTVDFSTTTTVTSDQANPSANHATVNLTATVTSAGGTPTNGTVQFYDDTLAIGGPVALNASGVATLAVSTALFESVSITQASESGNTVTITTNANNPVTVGQSVEIQGVDKGSTGSVNGNYTGGYNGIFTVATVSGNTFTYNNSHFANLPTDTFGGDAISLNTLNPGLHSISAIYTPSGTTFAGSAGVHEQSVQAAAFGATDTFTERLGDGITALNSRSPNPILGSVGATNYVDEINSSGVLVQSIVLPSADSQIFTATGASESGSTVTLTLASPTDFAVGQKVTVAGVSVAGYNGDFTITAVSNPVGGPYTIQYTAGSTGLGAGTGGTAQGVVHAVVGHGQQSTTGQMTLSGDGQYLFLNGYDQNPNPAGLGYASLPSVSANTVPRSIARIKYDGTVDTEAFTAGSTGVQTGGIIDATYSPDGNQFYLSGSGGKIYYFSSLVTSASLQGGASNVIATAAGTVTSLQGYGGQLYYIGGGSNAGTNLLVGTVGTGFPTAAATLAQLPGIPTNTTALPNTVFFPVDMYLTHTNGAGTALDTLYIADDGKNFGQGAITKWSLVGGNWVQNGAIPYTVTAQQLGFYWLAGTTDPTTHNVTLYSTYGNGGNADFGPGVLYSFTDTAGYNAAPAVSAVTTVDKVSGGPVGGPYNGNETFRGVALAPLAAVQSVVLNGITGAVTSATESGTTVTITTATPLGFIVGEVVTIAGDSVSGYNGTFKITGVSGNTFTYTDSASGLANGTGGTATFALAGAQRSMVDTVVYKFNQAVTLSANAFTFNVHGTASILTATESGTTVTVTTAANHGFFTGQVVTVAGVGVAGYNGTFTITVTSPTTFTYTDSTSGLANSGGGTAGVGQAPTVTYSSPDGGLTWIVSWSGTGVTGSSIADGVYDILLNPSAVTYNYSGATLTQSNRATDTFFRLYGDTDGNKTVNAVDNGKFKTAFGKSLGQTGYLDSLDYDNNSTINAVDNAQFKKRFGTSLSGFTTTI